MKSKEEMLSKCESCHHPKLDHYIGKDEQSNTPVGQCTIGGCVCKKFRTKTIWTNTPKPETIWTNTPKSPAPVWKNAPKS